MPFVLKERSCPIRHEIEVLAQEYLSAYRGGVPKSKVLPDFKIVATATMHKLDIVVSEDDRAMKSSTAIKACNQVNARKICQTPALIKLEKL